MSLSIRGTPIACLLSTPTLLLLSPYLTLVLLGPKCHRADELGTRIVHERASMAQQGIAGASRVARNPSCEDEDDIEDMYDTEDEDAREVNAEVDPVDAPTSDQDATEGVAYEGCGEEAEQPVSQWGLDPLWGAYAAVFARQVLRSTRVQGVPGVIHCGRQRLTVH